MWIDIDDLITPTVGVPQDWQAFKLESVKQEEEGVIPAVIGDDKDRPRDNLAILHRSLKQSHQLSETQEKQYFVRLQNIVSQIALDLVHCCQTRQTLVAYLASIASKQTPLDKGLSTKAHRLLMTDIKQMVESLEGYDKVLELANQLEKYSANNAAQLIKKLTLVDWPHQLVLAIAQSRFALSQPDQCSTYLTAFSSYLRLISYDVKKQTSQTDPDAEQNMASLIEQYFQCRNLLVNHNLRLVYHIAKKHASSPRDISDILQEGVFGLIRAIEKYKPQTGYRFSTYAYNWIDAKCRLTLTGQKGFMRLPTSATADLSELRKTAANLQSQGKLVTPINVAANSELSEPRVKTLLALNNNALSIDQPMINQEQALTLSNVLADRGQEVTDSVWQEELKQKVDVMLENLTEREAFILIHRFGLKGVAAQSLELISKNIGLSRERVRQIEKKILADLRELVEKQDLQ